MKKIRKSFDCIMFNLRTLIGFEFFYKIISLIIFSPLFLNLFNLIMKVTGYSYLTFENVFQFFLNPVTIILLFFLILLLLFYTMFDITAVIVILDMSYKKKYINIKDAIAISFTKLKNILKKENIFLSLFVLVLIPFLNFGLSGGFITSLKIPDYILAYISRNMFLLVIFILMRIVIFFLFVEWIYSLHYMILENKNFKEARKKSSNLIGKNLIKDVFILFLTVIISSFLYIVITFLGVFVIIVLNKVFGKLILIKSIITAIMWVFLAISLIIFTLLSTPISYSVVSVLFYQHKIDKKEKIVKLDYEVDCNRVRTNRYVKHLITLSFVFAVVFGSIFTYQMYKGRYNYNIEYVRRQEVTAHRGASAEYPENTMSAFIRAKELGADWIELDVQQTKDKMIVISHDSNLKRTAGVDKEIGKLNYNEIASLDVGSHMDKKFSNERIPLFEDVVKWASENNIRLNVELKLAGYEENLEKDVIDIIEKYNFQNDCVITAHSYELLESIKDSNPEIKTVYVIGFAYGDITKLDKADAFSIETSSVSKKLVSRVHNAGKELYVWTVNSKDNIEKMIKLNVDNIITDDITLTKDTIMMSRSSNLVKEFIRLIESLF